MLAQGAHRVQCGVSTPADAAAAADADGKRALSPAAPLGAESEPRQAVACKAADRTHARPDGIGAPAHNSLA